jgi:hypothetical protein
VAQSLYDRDQFVLANYVAGLSTECVLRAYRHMIDPEFDARHDLGLLFKQSKFNAVVPESRRVQVAAALVVAVGLWSNDHRFLSERALRVKWKRKKFDRGVKGDFVKERTRQLVNAASEIVTVGVTRWTSYFAR